jgi:hypothetical protein
MTTDELVTLIELWHKLKREISEEDFQAIRSLESDPEKYDIAIVNGKAVKQYTSNIYYLSKDLEYNCSSFRKKLEEKCYIIKSFNYLDNNGNVLYSAWSFYARRFSVAFVNPNWSLQNLDFMI